MDRSSADAACDAAISAAQPKKIPEEIPKAESDNVRRESFAAYLIVKRGALRRAFLKFAS